MQMLFENKNGYFKHHISHPWNKVSLLPVNVVGDEKLLNQNNTWKEGKQ